MGEMSREPSPEWFGCSALTLLHRDTVPYIPAEGSLEGPGLPRPSTSQSLI